MGTPLDHERGDSRRERFLDMAGLSQERPGPSAAEEQQQLAAMRAWLPTARARLREIELRRAPWRGGSRARRALQITLTVGFWAAGLYLTFLWSLFAFVPFLVFFLVCTFGTWAQSRAIEDLRASIEEVEGRLAEYRRSGHELDDEPPA